MLSEVCGSAPYAAPEVSTRPAVYPFDSQNTAAFTIYMEALSDLFLTSQVGPWETLPRTRHRSVVFWYHTLCTSCRQYVNYFFQIRFKNHDSSLICHILLSARYPMGQSDDGESRVCILCQWRYLEHGSLVSDKPWTKRWLQWTSTLSFQLNIVYLFILMLSG
jgi:hypothetical protein